jgi:hypothetical protein
MSLRKTNRSLTFPLLLWLTPQLCSLAVSASRLPLSAHPPRPLESIALPQLAAVQIVTAAMLAPLLFQSISCGVAITLSAAPMLQLAGFLSSASMGSELALSLHCACWALGLCAICLELRKSNRVWVCIIVTTWSLGGLLLAYLNSEFAPSRHLPDVFFGPALMSIRVAERAQHEAIPARLWWLLGVIPVVILIAAHAGQRARRSNPRENTSVERNGNSFDALKP